MSTQYATVAIITQERHQSAVRLDRMTQGWKILGALGLLAGAGAAFAAKAQRSEERTEQPDYTVTERDEGIEIRDYPAMTVAKVTVDGPAGQARNRGFRILADYIFGNNVPSDKIAMTSPVTQQRGEKIAMTAPVTQAADGASWTVSFIMPSEYTMATLPVPASDRITLSEVPARRMAAITFNGFGNADALETHEAKLREYLARNNLKATGEGLYAFYDGPWVPPQRRRNEVMLQLSAEVG